QPGGQYHQRRPYQFGYRPQGIEHQPHQGLGRPAEASSGGQGQCQTEQGGQQGAQGGHRQGLQRATPDRQQVRLAQVRLQEARGVGAHLAQVVGLTEEQQVQTQIDKGRHHGDQRGQQQQQANGPLHASLPRSSRLRPSANNTSSRKVSSMLATSSPANMRRDRSICWPKIGRA